ncbi:hypothetical protein GCM10011416_23040 [Polaribacter pacificus]|uniref:Thioredoxin domain-containing protein n=2 Tax=Polaribacter pacificus TaxID=1775173 RepID=A0A917I2H5_9FLAO|nr:hypothetical protein GCM10011416_23040 [Polaribacter pacificus]
MVTINGVIENFSKEDSIEDVKVYSYDFLTNDWAEEHQAIVDENGHFSLQFLSAYDQVLFFRFKQSSNLFVSPNSTLDLTFDAKAATKKEFLNSLRFTNELAKENELLKKYLLNDPLDYNELNTMMSSKTSPEEIQVYLSELYDQKKAPYIDNFIKENNPPKSIKNWLKIEKELKPIIDYLQYAVFHFRATSKETPYKDNFPKAFTDRIDNLPILTDKSFVNNDVYTTLPNYYNAYLGQYVQSKYQVPWVKADSIIYSKEIFSFKNNPAFIRILYFDRLNNSLKNNDLSFYNTHQKTIDSLFKNTVYEKAIQEKYTSTKNLIESPQLPENTELLEFSSDDATTFLDEIIKNANGKVIYIDNWATWCSPCKEQFKNATPQLKEKFSEDVEFVYLCHLSDKNLYLPTISQYKVQGKHYFITDEQNKVLTKLLNITGYPTYNLINKKGEIVHSGFQFRPSETITTKLLTALIKE